MPSFASSAAFIAALTKQLAHQEYDGSPLKLQIAFPDRAAIEKHRRLHALQVQDVGDAAVLVRYRDGPIPHLYCDPLRGNYESLYLRHALRGLLPATEHAALLNGRNIDHVFPRRAAILNGIGFVLLLPCDAGANMSAGGGVERRQAFDWEKPPREYGADWSTLAKFSGLLSPSISARADCRAEAARLVNQLSQRFPATVRNEPWMVDMVAAWLDWTRRRV